MVDTFEQQKISPICEMNVEAGRASSGSTPTQIWTLSSGTWSTHSSPFSNCSFINVVSIESETSLSLGGRIRAVAHWVRPRFDPKELRVVAPRSISKDIERLAINEGRFSCYISNKQKEFGDMKG